MPKQQDLPESLAGLARCNALFIRHESFGSDAARLVTAIERVLAPDGNALEETGLKPVRNDRARATRLLNEAVRIAPAISDKSSQARALADIAGKLAATDPDRAARLFADAERIAQAIPIEGSKARALADIAGKLAATNPDRAEHIAQAITDEYWNVWALVRIAEATTKA